MVKTLDDFYNDLGARESGGNYKAVNSFGFIGKYQMGEAAMVDAGYYKPRISVNYSKNIWDGQFTGKDGVYSVEDFLNNPQAQENAQRMDLLICIMLLVVLTSYPQKFKGIMLMLKFLTPMILIRMLLIFLLKWGVVHKKPEN